MRRGPIKTASKTAEDIRFAPAYTSAEVSRYTHVNPHTLRTWVCGRAHATVRDRRYAPVIHQAENKRPDSLSFINLIEAHVLVALRKGHSISLPKIRKAVDWLRDETGSRHPLAELQIETDGLNVFIRHLGRLISASERGQVVIREVVERFLRRVERDSSGLPTVFYPFTQDNPGDDAPKEVVIAPSIAFGRPTIRGTRIATAIIYERYKAGESLVGLAKDYNLELTPIEEALRCEIERRAA